MPGRSSASACSTTSSAAARLTPPPATSSACGKKGSSPSIDRRAPFLHSNARSLCGRTNPSSPGSARKNGLQGRHNKAASRSRRTSSRETREHKQRSPVGAGHPVSHFYTPPCIRSGGLDSRSPFRSRRRRRKKTNGTVFGVVADMPDAGGGTNEGLVAILIDDGDEQDRINMIYMFGNGRVSRASTLVKTNGTNWPRPCTTFGASFFAIFIPAFFPPYLSADFRRPPTDYT